MLTRRSFFSFLVPLAVIPVVGPHMLLAERPRYYPGWRKEWRFFHRQKDGAWLESPGVDISNIDWCGPWGVYKTV